MAVETEADRAALLRDFGVTVTYSGGSFTAIHDSAFELLPLGEVIGVATTQPRLLARTSDVSALARGTTLTVNGINHKLEEHQPDGTGFTLLLLSKA